MGVYIFKSIHGPYIKVGHYKGLNAWSRIAHRGFYSCVCPNDIRDRVSVQDMELCAWFPNLTKKEERMVKTKWKLFRIYQKSEWFPDHLYHDILTFLTGLDECDLSLCNLEEALMTRSRL